MARYGDRKSGSSRGSRRSSGGRSGGGRRGGRGKGKGDTEFVMLGDLSNVKSMSDNEDYQEITEDLIEMEGRFNLRVYVGDQETVTLRNGDTILVKFKEYEKAPEFVVGKAFLMINEED